MSSESGKAPVFKKTFKKKKEDNKQKPSDAMQSDEPPPHPREKVLFRAPFIHTPFCPAARRMYV